MKLETEFFNNRAKDWAVCLCGNDPSRDGFYPCLHDGLVVEPDLNGPWAGALYYCERCHRIVDMEAGIVKCYASDEAVAANETRYDRG